LKKIPETLKGSIMTTALENEYLRVSGKADLINYDKDEYDSVGVWRDFRKAQLEDIDNLIQQFADSLHIPGITKQDIQAAIGDDAALTEKFIAWIGTSGNRDVADNLLTAMGRLNTEDEKDNNLPHTQEKVDVSKKDFPITYTWTDETAQDRMITLQESIKAGGNLSDFEKRQMEELKRRFPMGDIGSANIPRTVDAWWGY